ncbi:hypothetical protein PROFUN_14271 [Planoprotostelium fungivorum]|uniref:Phosphoglycerate mutase-like protein n=1 Tax=Planoprotostelium fungivorum TaxID=1890364 RepID=A0A2P6N0C5_9EUKA|nr:hypothetical protein PROFUN_14271 [Planoprotostelium fungivorum]
MKTFPYNIPPTDDNCYITIIRHGETEDNIRGIIQGQKDTDLNEKGFAQARLVADRIQGERVDLIISSDLKRARDTAKIIHERHPNAEFRIDPRIREKAFGPELEGRNWNDIQRMLLTSGTHFDDYGEPETQVIERLSSIYHESIDKATSSDSPLHIVFVSHGGAISRLLKWVARQSGQPVEGPKLGNTCVSRIMVKKEDGKRVGRIVERADTRHLQEDREARKLADNVDEKLEDKLTK